MEHYEVDVNNLSPRPDDTKSVKENFLGQGSYGLVYRAVYRDMKVAVKSIRDDIIEDSSKEISKECSVMIQLHHENLGRLYGFNLNKGSACMVMELAELGSLYDILKNKIKYPHLSWHQRLAIARDIIRGLHCLHDRRLPILHRDLKSLNVLLRQNWSAFLCDFGFAQIKLTSQTLGTKGIGSAPWMAPELQDPDEISTTAVDIYSFGMILYELLTRETPFGIEKLTATQIAVAVFRGKRPIHVLEESAYESIKGCPEGYMELMRECWDQEPSKRPKASNILARLETFLKATLMKKESKEEAFVNSLLSPLGLEEAYSKIFLEEGYDSVLAVRDLTIDDLKSMKVKGGHQRIILNAIRTVSDSSISSGPNQMPSYIEQSSLLTVHRTKLQLGHLHRTGTGGMKQSHQEALKFYLDAAAQGDAEAEAWVAFSYLRAEGGIKRDDSEAFRLSKLGVEKGVPLAYCNYGRCYELGRGVEKDANEAVRLYRRGVELGESYAQNALGLCYCYETGVKKDENEAARLYQLASEQGNTDAQYNLGICYSFGIGVKKDEKEAVRLYQLASEQGNTDAQYNLGVCYRFGIGVQRDEKEAVRLYQLASEQGHAGAESILGVCYRYGIGVTKDEKEAVRLYQLAAEQGHPNAQYNLGVCYANGTGANKDEKQAVRWYQLASEQGHADARYALGLCYANGIGLKKDEKEAVRLYQLASKQGHANAQYNLGFCYRYGTGVTKDEKEAVRLYQLAAKQGNADAQYNLGVCYANGIGVMKDEKRAVQLYQLASEQGHANAQYNLGVRYSNGTGVKKDDKEAVRLYQLASAQGNANAQYNLGVCYFNGTGVQKDEKEALRWYEMAKKNGSSGEPLGHFSTLRKRVSDLSGKSLISYLKH